MRGFTRSTDDTMESRSLSRHRFFTVGKHTDLSAFSKRLTAPMRSPLSNFSRPANRSSAAYDRMGSRSTLSWPSSRTPQHNLTGFHAKREGWSEERGHDTPLWMLGRYTTSLQYLRVCCAQFEDPGEIANISCTFVTKFFNPKLAYKSVPPASLLML